jgi:zinc protease
MMKSRFFPLAFLAALCLGALCLGAIPAFSQTPASTKFLDPAAISLRVLPNGVRGIVQENPGTDLVSVQVWIKAGSRFENKDNNGVTHLIESLALLGAGSTPNAKNADIEPSKVIAELGGDLGSLSSRDSMFYSATVAAPFLAQTLRALSAATLSPDLSDAKVEVAKEALLAELAAQSDPLLLASDLAYATAFETHPYRRPAQGTPSGVAALTGAIVREFHKTRFAGGNISVVVSGDVERLAGHQLIAQYFAHAPKAAPETQPAPAKPLSGVLPASRRGSLPITVESLAFRSPPVSEAMDAVAADVLLSHWKEGREAALRSVLRADSPDEEDEALFDDEDADDENAGDQAPAPAAPPENEDEDNAPLALGFEADYLTQRDSGLFLITLIAPRERAAAESAVLDNIARIQNEGLGEEELSRAKNLLRHQYIRQGETLSGQAGSLGFYDMIDSYEFAITYLERIDKITNDDIKRVATTYFKTDAHVQATIEAIRPPVEKPQSGTLTARLPS